MALLPRGQSAQARVAGLVWTFPQDQQAAIAQLSDSELLNRLQAAFGYRLGRFEAIGQRQFYPLRLVVATEQVRSHLVLQGNAAHFCTQWRGRVLTSPCAMACAWPRC